MVQNPYYPSEAEQDAALTEYDKRMFALLDYVREQMHHFQMSTPVGNHLLNELVALNPGDTIMKYRVTVPTGQTKTTTNSRNQLVGVPDLGESEHYLMTEDELNQWFESWKADGATGPFVIIEQLAR